MRESLARITERDVKVDKLKAAIARSKRLAKREQVPAIKLAKVA